MPSADGSAGIRYWAVTLAPVADDDPAGLEAAMGLLMAAGAEQFWWQDGQPSSSPYADAFPAAEASSPGGRFRFVRAYFLDDAQWPRRRAVLEAGVPELAGGFVMTVEAVVPEQWESAWKRYYRPRRLPRQTWLVPAWYPTSGRRDPEREIRLDPGMAFGTGSHPTTQACLALLAGLNLTGATVADVGAGSGILALAAYRWGAARVVAVEPDPVAVRALRHNLAINRAQAVAVVAAPWERWLAREGAPRRYEVVLANLVWRMIEPLLQHLPAVLAPSATVIVSGILAEDEARLRAALTAAGGHWRLRRRRIAGGWLTALLEWRGDPA